MSCVTTGSLTILISKIPILGNLLILGGLGYGTLKIYVEQ